MPLDPSKVDVARAAAVRGARRVEEVEAYLPDNYFVERSTVEADGRLVVYILGYDVAGWTLDDYVAPRLASGLMYCNTIPASEA